MVLKTRRLVDSLLLIKTDGGDEIFNSLFSFRPVSLIKDFKFSMLYLCSILLAISPQEILGLDFLMNRFAAVLFDETLETRLIAVKHKTRSSSWFFMVFVSLTRRKYGLCWLTKIIRNTYAFFLLHL